MAAAEDWGADEIFSVLLGVLGEITEDAFNSLAHLGTSPRPRKAQVLEEILRKGLGDMGSCPIPPELWDRLGPEGLGDRLQGVSLPEGKGYPSPATEVLLGALQGQGVALQQPIPTDRHDTTNGWTSEKLPSVRKWRMNTPPGLNGSGG